MKLIRKGVEFKFFKIKLYKKFRKQNIGKNLREKK